MMLASSTVKWFFAGLMALVPVKDGFKVLAVDAHYHADSSDQDCPKHFEHRPLLAFPRHLLGRNVICLDEAQIAPRDKALPKLLAQDLCVIPLDGTDVSIETKPREPESSREKGREEMLWRPSGQFPATAQEVRDYRWIAQMSSIHWPSRKVRKGLLEDADPPGIASRIQVPNSLIGVCHLASSAEGGEEKIPYFYTVTTGGVTNTLHTSAMADATRMIFHIDGNELKIVLKNRASGTSNTLALTGDPIQLLTFNLMEPEEACQRDRTTAYDFSHFYDLTEDPPKCKDRWIPRASLADATAQVRNDHCGSNLLKNALAAYACSDDEPDSSANNRPACPMIGMQD
jgi:hypothetical protein